MDVYVYKCSYLNTFSEIRLECRMDVLRFRLYLGLLLIYDDTIFLFLHHVVASFVYLGLKCNFLLDLFFFHPFQVFNMLVLILKPFLLVIVVFLLASFLTILLSKFLVKHLHIPLLL